MAALQSMVHNMEVAISEVAAAIKQGNLMGLNDKDKVRWRKRLSISYVLKNISKHILTGSTMQNALRKDTKGKLTRSARLKLGKYYNKQTELFVNMRDAGLVSFQALAAFRDALPSRFMPGEQRLSRSRKDMNERADRIMPLFYSLPNDQLVWADGVGQKGVCTPLIRKLQILVGLLVFENEHLFPDPRNVRVIVCASGDGTIVGRQKHAVTQVCFRIVNDGLEDQWQSPDHVITVSVFEGNDTRENLAANAQEAFRALEWLQENKLEFFHKKGEEKFYATVDVHFPADMKAHWAVLGIDWQKDKEKKFCPMCHVTKADTRLLYEYKEPQPGQTAEEFAYDHGMDMEELEALNREELEDSILAAEAEKSYQKKTTGERPPKERRCKLRAYLPSPEGDALPFPENAGFLRVWRIWDACRDYPNSLIKGLKPEKVGMDAEHAPMRIGEAMMNFILERVLHGGPAKDAESRVDAVNSALRRAKASFIFHKASKDSGHSGYLSVGLDGSQARKLANTYEEWLPVAERWSAEGTCPLLSRLWGYFRKFITLSRKTHLDKDEQWALCLTAKRFVRTFHLV
eukprot:jgi/Mesvir1/13250/Mv12229-RA.1